MKTYRFFSPQDKNQILSLKNLIGCQFCGLEIQGGRFDNLPGKSYNFLLYGICNMAFFDDKKRVWRHLKMKGFISDSADEPSSYLELKVEFHKKPWRQVKFNNFAIQWQRFKEPPILQKVLFWGFNQDIDLKNDSGNAHDFKDLSEIQNNITSVLFITFEFQNNRRMFLIVRDNLQLEVIFDTKVQQKKALNNQFNWLKKNRLMLKCSV
jgi:hypothetical protein